MILKEELRNQLLREADTQAEVEVTLEEKGIQQIYPQGDLQRAKETVESLPHMYPLIKTEYVYEDDSDDHPQVITKEVPFTATELGKLKKRFCKSCKGIRDRVCVESVFVRRGWNFVVRKEAEGFDVLLRF